MAWIIGLELWNGMLWLQLYIINTQYSTDVHSVCVHTPTSSMVSWHIFLSSSIVSNCQLF